MQVHSLFIYPIKSLQGIPVDHWMVEKQGLAFDRRWMLVNEEGHFLTQRNLPVTASLSVQLLSDHLVVNASGHGCVEVPFVAVGVDRPVQIWRSNLEAQVVDPAVDRWFSEVLGQPASLVHFSSRSKRAPNQDYAQKQDKIAFADGYPILVTTNASLADLNSRLEQPVGMDRFRANIVLDGVEPWEEDDWKELTIGEVKLRVAKPCGRCGVVCTDQKTGDQSEEPLATLVKFRKHGRSVDFGMNFIPETLGQISVGDFASVASNLSFT